MQVDHAATRPHSSSKCYAFARPSHEQRRCRPPFLGRCCRLEAITRPIPKLVSNRSTIEERQRTSPRLSSAFFLSSPNIRKVITPGLTVSYKAPPKADQWTGSTAKTGLGNQSIQQWYPLRTDAPDTVESLSARLGSRKNKRTKRQRVSRYDMRVEFPHPTSASDRK